MCSCVRVSARARVCVCQCVCAYVCFCDCDTGLDTEHRNINELKWRCTGSELLFNIYTLPLKETTIHRKHTVTLAQTLNTQISMPEIQIKMYPTQHLDTLALKETTIHRKHIVTLAQTLNTETDTNELKSRRKRLLLNISIH